MIRFPNCKINLGLYITRRRDDGYHDLETVFYPVPLRDVLEIIPADKTQLHLSGKSVAGDTENNLVWKAHQLLKERFPGKVPEMDIYLHKAIPMGAGMGGGSADGAFMLSLINDYCNLGMKEKELADLALLLGSDCPFFIFNTPQYATGRGEQMQPIHLDLSSYSLQLICPGIHVSTGKTFSMITPKAAPFSLMQLDKLPVNEWKEKVSNDFEAPVFREHPELADIKEQLYKAGAVYAAMSGSGSTVFGIFEKGKKATFAEKNNWEIFYIDQL